MKARQKIIPKTPDLDVQPKIIEDSSITIIPETIIILAPKKLQKVVNIDKYKKELIGQEKSINDLYKIAEKLTEDFNDKGYPLVRVILPSQELDSENASVFFKIIDGTIETLDLSNVPPKQALRIYHYLKPLIKKEALTQKEINRRLILASSISGINLNSGFLPGTKIGGTRLIIEATHKYVSGGVEFNNFQSEQLGRQQGQINASINSALGLGETISMFGLSRPTFKGVNGNNREVPIRAGVFLYLYLLGMMEQY